MITQHIILSLMTLSPDVCEVVARETQTPTICQPHLEGTAPTLDEDICCAGGQCYALGSGCGSTETQYYCALGTIDVTGEATCYWEVPNACDAQHYTCEQTINPPPSEEKVCCPASEDVCWPFESPSQCDVGDVFICLNGVTNTDGTVTCFEGI